MKTTASSPIKEQNMTVSSTTPPVPSLRRAKALAAIAAFATAMVVAFTASPAQAVPLQVRQGQTIVLCTSAVNDPNSCEPEQTVTVAPLVGGTVTTDDSSGAFIVRFTASPNFLGTVAVSYTNRNQDSLLFEVQVVAETANASGSFVPVAAPGPCLLITVNPVVDFGNVTLGSDYTTAAAPPQIAGCAPSGVTQDIAIRATNAQNGLTSLNVDDSCPVDPVNPPANPLQVCEPAVGTYSVAVPSTTQSTTQTDRNLLVRSVSSVLLENEAGSFATTLVDLAVKLPSELAPTFVGSIFTFDVVFTAIPS